MGTFMQNIDYLLFTVVAIAGLTGLSIQLWQVAPKSSNPRVALVRIGPSAGLGMVSRRCRRSVANVTG